MSLFQAIERVLITLFPYQAECKSAVFSFFEKYRKLLAVLPTGAGKTIIFSHIAQDWPGRVLILAHRDELITQAVDKLWKATGLEAQKEKGEDRADLSARIVVGSIQTLMREKRLARWPKDHFSLIIVDEAHHILAESYQTVLSHFDAYAKILGVTATPDRGDRKNLGQYFEHKAYEISLFELISQGYLSRIKIKTIPISIDLSGVKIEKGDFDLNDLDAQISRYLEEIAHSIRENAPFRKVLIFLPLIKTSLAMVEACRKAGLAAEHIDGTSEDRKSLLSRFEKNEFDVLCNAMLLSEGYDCPDVDCIVVLRPTKIRSLYAQMIGRGTRISKGKDFLLVCDFLWMHERHDIIKPVHLIATDDKVADVMSEIAEKGGEIELEELQGRAAVEIEKREAAETEAARQREANLVETIKENAGKKKRFVDAMEFSLSLHDEEALAFVPANEAEAAKPTEKQIQFLVNMGIDPEGIKFSGLASRICGRIIARRKMDLASPKQLQLLRKFRHPEAELVTFKEASDLINEYLGRNRR